MRKKDVEASLWRNMMPQMLCVKYEAPDKSDESTLDIAAALMADNPNIEIQYGTEEDIVTGKTNDGFAAIVTLDSLLAMAPMMTGGIMNKKHPKVEKTERIWACFVVLTANAL